MKVYDLETAPEASKPLLEKTIKGFGMVPNIHGVMAGAPALLEAYQTIHKLFMCTSFNEDEITVVWQTINVEQGCHYCVSAHTSIAYSMNVVPAITEALRNQKEMPTPKLQALHEMTLKVVRNRGILSEDDTAAFYSAGYGEQQLMEIILGVSQKVMSNYVNHSAGTPIDEPFLKYAWKKKV